MSLIFALGVFFFYFFKDIDFELGRLAVFLHVFDNLERDSTLFIGPLMRLKQSEY